jgi:hypothetical protein
MVLSTRRLPSLLRGPGEPSSPALSGTTKALRLPIAYQWSLIWFASTVHPILLLLCPPQRSARGGGPLPARALGAGCPYFRLFRVDDNGISQVSRQSVPCLCSAPRPRPNRCVLAMSATSMLPPLCAQRRLRQLLFRGSLTQLRHPLTYASRFVLPLTRKARFRRLAGFAGRASNPLDRYERFQLVLTTIPLSCSPDASAISVAHCAAPARNH